MAEKKYKIGIDFGTTNTVISYWDGSMEDNNIPVIKGFDYPAQHGSIYIPSIICQEEDNFEVGHAAYQIGNYSKAMKMYLPMNEEERVSSGWASKKTPEEMISEFFKKILVEGQIDSFETNIGKIDEIVLCVPHVWNNELNHPGREKLRDILENLGYKVKRIVSEPVAASAYFVHDYKKSFTNTRDFFGNLLVCDMGGGTFDVTLCNVNEGGKIEGIKNEGNGVTSDLKGKAGVYFDENLIQNMSRRISGDELDMNCDDFLEIYSALQMTKYQTPSQRVQKPIDLGLASTTDEDKAGIDVYRVGGKKFTYLDVEKSFAEVKKGIEAVLEKIKSDKLEIDAFFLTGGFNQFYLCRKAIIDYLGIEDKKSNVYGSSTNTSIAGKSIAFGATLVANGFVNIDERFPHNIGFVEYQLNPQTNDLDLGYKKMIESGKKIQEYKELVYCDKKYKKIGNKPLSFKLFVEFNGNAEDRHEFVFNNNVELPNSNISDNYWSVGMRMDDSQIIYVAFRDKNNRMKEHKLVNIAQFEGKLISK